VRVFDDELIRRERRARLADELEQTAVMDARERDSRASAARVPLEPHARCIRLERADHPDRVAFGVLQLVESEDRARRLMVACDELIPDRSVELERWHVPHSHSMRPTSNRWLNSSW